MSYLTNHYKEEEETLNKTLNRAAENNPDIKIEENKTPFDNETQIPSSSEGTSFRIIPTIKPSLIQRSCLKQMQVHNLPKVDCLL